MKKVKTVIKHTLKKNKTALLLIICVGVIEITVFKLYNLIIEPLIYSGYIIMTIALILLLIDFIGEYRKMLIREKIKSEVLSNNAVTEHPHELADEAYFEIIRELRSKIDTTVTKYETEKQDTCDYYSSWVHQIKTPIAVLKLLCSDESEQSRAIRSELFRIEQYVEMVLSYIRLGSDTNDLVIKEYKADEIIREIIRKLAPQFVAKKLKLEYTESSEIIVTDKKWFSCILEQILTNAVKYTNEGTVNIKVSNGKISVRDTGIGILKEDIPRIFEKGYTGVNGRLGQKSSGLGLYLCKLASEKINVKLKCESIPNIGSTFTIIYKNGREQ